MVDYEVYATSWDDPRVVEDIVPARDLQFSFPLCDHGEASFTATVEPSRSMWRAAIGLPRSGILITRDGQPIWAGWLNGDRQTGPRTFQFSAKEWGSFFARTPAPVGDWANTNTHTLFRALVTGTQAVTGQNVQVQVGSTLGATSTYLTVSAWDTSSTEELFRQVADAEGGPEWYFGVVGTYANPKRVLVLGDKLGTVSEQALHYVENTLDPDPADTRPTLALLSDLFATGRPSLVRMPGRRGGNVLAMARTRDVGKATTAAIGIGDGVDAAQLRRTATADTLIANGWPKMTSWNNHNNVSSPDVLQKLTNADLSANAGIPTGYNLVTFDGDPDWTQIPRGSTLRVDLDTDAFAGERPYRFDARVLGISVAVPNDRSTAQVTWSVAERMEV